MACIIAALLVLRASAAPPDEATIARVAATFDEVRPLVARYCFECHSRDLIEAEIDLAVFADLAAVRRQPRTWQKIGEMLDSGQMPPKGAKQPSDADRLRMQQWVHDYLNMEARACSGDPGRVLLRRLSNAEYTYTLRDLTGVESLAPAREFPADGAAGEGFTNTGDALVISPSLVTKYFDAAKEVAAHAVLLPDGLRFSPYDTRRDWSDELVKRIRDFYTQYTDNSGASRVNLQGIVFDTNQGGRLPLERYFAATLEDGQSLRANPQSMADFARKRDLSPKYLGSLWDMLTHRPGEQPSILLDNLRARWTEATPSDLNALVAFVESWQAVLWRFNSVGHIGKEDGPKAWLESIDPIASRQDFRVKLNPPASGEDVVVYLAAGDADDGREHDFVLWERPRLVAAGRPDISLRDVGTVHEALKLLRTDVLASASKCLNAATQATANPGRADLDALARHHNVNRDVLAAWFGYLGVTPKEVAGYGKPLTRKERGAAGYDFVHRWVSDNALSIVANSSDEEVNIPGRLKPRSVAVHPSPTTSVVVGWRSPVSAKLAITGTVQDAHLGCGNGIAWSLEMRRSGMRYQLAAGVSDGSKAAMIGPIPSVPAQAGDLLALAIHPRDGDHGCDLTAIDLTLSDDEWVWNLSRELSSDLLSGNPHADSFGNGDVWHFFSEPATTADGSVLPADSLLARWHLGDSSNEKEQLAAKLQELINVGGQGLSMDSPDALLIRQLASPGGPLLSTLLRAIVESPVEVSTEQSRYGIDPLSFGTHPQGKAVEPENLCVQAPAVFEVRLPADLAAGAELVVGGTLHSQAGEEASAQLQVLTTPPFLRLGAASGSFVAHDGSAARRRLFGAFNDFRALFPAALCYSKIVPVDEVVTLHLYYRQDEHLKRLALDDTQAMELDRMWDELLYVSQHPLLQVDAFLQKIEYAGQLGDPKPYEIFRQPLMSAAAAFRQRLIDTEPKHLEAVLKIADRAYRRPLSADEAQLVRGLYRNLRERELPHDDAIRLTLARVLVSPAFLYRAEVPGPGENASPVSDGELASRLSYFLWSSQPDDELRELAAEGRLREPEVLAAQTRRMLRDPKARRLAIEFACQWLHIRDFDQLDEKSERHFPTFADVRGAMYEESIQFFTHLLQNDRSVLEILDADYTFLDEKLAQHYGMTGVSGSEFRRVDGVRMHGRGGILTQASTLSKQSGASRTSPILRGNWLSEVVLGEKLPRPPKDVPQLADAAPEGLTERKLIERHSTDEACIKCHSRIDPFGFALENYDAIGRFRTRDSSGLPIDSRTTLPDGTMIDGANGLRSYLLTARREAFVRQFLRKLMGYALGRSVQLSDEPLLAELTQEQLAPDQSILRAIERIVLSPQFRQIRGKDSGSDP